MAISQHPILPPPWATLDTDAKLYPRPRPLRTPPERIGLVNACGSLCGSVQPSVAPKEDKKARLFTLLDCHEVIVETQPCHCGQKRCRVGPDPYLLGIFNYNNSMLFSHELLDDYTSQYTSSETPFFAWVTVMTRRYTATEQKFVSNDEFRAVWFAYVRLQVYESDMRCPTCGPTPDHVIWDGMTLAFYKKNRTSTLQPPTTIVPGKSSVRAEVRAPTKVQWVGDKELRADCKRVISAPLKEAGAEGNISLSTSDHLTLLDYAFGALDSHSYVGQGYSFVDLFRDYYGCDAFASRRSSPPRVSTFFEQVSNLFPPCTRRLMRCRSCRTNRPCRWSHDPLFTIFRNLSVILPLTQPHNWSSFPACMHFWKAANVFAMGASLRAYDSSVLGWLYECMPCLSK